MPRIFQYQKEAHPLSQDVGFVETVTLDKWFQPASQPIFIPHRAQQGSQVVVLNLPNPIVAFGWYAETSQPIFVKPRIQPLIANSLVAPSTVVSDGVIVLIDLVSSGLR